MQFLRQRGLTISLLFLTIVAAVALVGCQTNAVEPDVLLRNVLANATYLSDFTQSGTAPLTDGEYREPAAPGSASEVVVRLTEYVARGPMAGGLDVAAVVLATESGGSGTFVELAVLAAQDDKPVNFAKILLGDRVQVQSLAIEDEVIQVEMITFGPDDPLCCPTQRVRQTYGLGLNQLSEELLDTVAPPPAASVNGSVTYLVRSALPDDAQILVVLREMNAAAPTPVLANTRFATAGQQVPIGYSIAYDAALIDPNRTYGLEAFIFDGQDNLMFASPSLTAVITQGAPTVDVELVVEPVLAPPATASVNGSVTYLVRSALPDDAHMLVVLREMNAGAPTPVLANTQFATAGQQVPIAYDLPYDEASIDQARSYGVEAFIFDSADQLLYASQAMIPVITQGNPTTNVEIIVEPVLAPEAPAPEATATSAPVPEQPIESAVLGSVSYAQMMALPDDAQLTVVLREIASGAPTPVLAETNYGTAGSQVPLPFTLGYDPTLLDPGRSYGVEAFIYDSADQLLFASQAMIPVITQGNPSTGVEIIVEPVLAPEAPAPEATATSAPVPEQPIESAVLGSVSYAQMMALPDDAQLTVVLREIASGAPTPVLAETSFATAGSQVPLPFTLGYDPTLLDPGRSYGVEAFIYDSADQLLFASQAMIPVITQGNPTTNVEIVVSPPQQ